MAVINGEQFHPHYRQVSAPVITEISRRAGAYSRSPERMKTQDEMENSLVFSYSKMAYAKVTGEKGLSMGSYPNETMNSNKDGNLTLYRPVSNKPKFPLLQSVEINTDGKLGSVIKGSFSFVVFPQVYANGTFYMDDIEQQFFSPGKEVLIEYGWSTTNTDVNNGRLKGIIYNFDWSVNPDLSISGKCQICSPGTLVLGISGEQTNPNSEPLSYDAANRPIANADLIGIINEDLQTLGLTRVEKIKGMSVGNTDYIGKEYTKNKKLGYWVICLPEGQQDISIEAGTTSNLTPLQKQKQQAIAKIPSKYANEDWAEIVANEHIDIDTWLQTQSQDDKATAQVWYDEWKKAGKTHVDPKHFEQVTPPLIGNRPKAYNIDNINDRNHPGNLLNSDYSQRVSAIRTARLSNSASNTSNQGGILDWAAGVGAALANQPIDNTQNNITTPQPTSKQQQVLAKPVYYISLGDLIYFLNNLGFSVNAKGNPNTDDSAAKIYDFQVWGNTTQYLGSVSWGDSGAAIVSCIPEEVFFPDPYMGSYGSFTPFREIPDLMFNDDGISTFSGGKEGPRTTNNKKNGLINIATILISTLTITEIYKSFLEENQTNIELKNITSFIDKIIKKINFASGEMYQLSTVIIDTTDKNGKSSAVVSIEDTHVTTPVINSVKTFRLPVSATTPVIKTLNVSCKPPAASAHAAFVEARAPRSRNVGDVSYTRKGDDTDNPARTEFLSAISQIQDLKLNFSLIGYGPSFTNAMKGNYTKVKRSSSSKYKKNHWAQRIVYPIELSLTLDGIDGFKFGDTITVSYLPSSYYGTGGEKFVFTVTKISHSIQNYVWETTLNCKARIQADS